MNTQLMEKLSKLTEDEIQFRVESIRPIMPDFLNYSLGGSTYNAELALENLGKILYRDDYIHNVPLLAPVTAHEAMEHVKRFESSAFPMLLGAYPTGREDTREVLFYQMKAPGAVYFFGDSPSRRLFMKSIASGIQEILGEASREQVKVLAVGNPSDVRPLKKCLQLDSERDATYTFQELKGIKNDMNRYIQKPDAEQTVVFIFNDNEHNDLVTMLLTPALLKQKGYHVILATRAEDFNRVPNGTVFGGAGLRPNLHIFPTQVIRLDNSVGTSGARYWMFDA